MHDLGRNEDRLRGTYEFPFEFHHIDSSHPRYVMSYHWHVECEIMRVLQGTLTVTLDEKSFTAKAGDVIFVNVVEFKRKFIGTSKSVLISSKIVQNTTLLS